MGHQTNFAFCNLLLNDSSAVHGAWRNSANIEFALSEVEDWIRIDRITAVDKLTKLRQRVMLAYREHFNDDFRPGEPLKQVNQLVSMYLPELAQRLYLVCKLFDVED